MSLFWFWISEISKRYTGEKKTWCLNVDIVVTSIVDILTLLTFWHYWHFVYCWWCWHWPHFPLTLLYQHEPIILMDSEVIRLSFVNASSPAVCHQQKRSLQQHTDWPGSGWRRKSGRIWCKKAVKRSLSVKKRTCNIICLWSRNVNDLSWDIWTNVLSIQTMTVWQEIKRGGD